VVLYFILATHARLHTGDDRFFPITRTSFVKHDAWCSASRADDCLNARRFRDRHGVTIGLLSDTEGEVCRKYGVLQEKEVEGAGRRECLVRSTFIVDKKKA